MMGDVKASAPAQKANSSRGEGAKPRGSIKSQPGCRRVTKDIELAVRFGALAEKEGNPRRVLNDP